MSDGKSPESTSERRLKCDSEQNQVYAKGNLIRD